ncbi:hypothetical protein [Parasitella parasitica]|uniref:Embryonic stem cell-specific 5-hydroxymethylcytosine-binding protein n=1 Tax=Parasitella parasitica TaxID=35722 RepID=A0A0B7MPS3_9FUNG|nr:hypothetical protein [Parasitella parasitica]
MCGRFCCSLGADDIRNELYQENVLPNTDAEWVDQDTHRPSYNVCPTRYIPTVLEKNKNEKMIQSMQWGFIPSWLKDAPYNKPINARLETLTEDKSIFFEWNKKKQVFYVKRRDGKLMLFAGLYSIATIESQAVATCTIITTAASAFFSKVHHRMPVILEPSDVNVWINNNIPWSPTVINLLKPFSGELDCFQVSPKVGPTKNDTPDLITPLDEQKSSISHFLKPVDLQDEMRKMSATNTDQKETNNYKEPSLCNSIDKPSIDPNKKRKRRVDGSPGTLKSRKITSFFSKK